MPTEKVIPQADRLRRPPSLTPDLSRREAADVLGIGLAKLDRSRCSCRKPLTDYAYSLWGRTPRVCADTSARPYDGLRCRWSG
jgi:hypothetical protein